MQIIQLFKNYNLASTSYIYGYFSPWQNARKFVKTSGSSTTVVDAVTDGNALDEVAVGDEMAVNRDGTVDGVMVDAKASGASITVSSAVNWERSGTGYPYQFRKRNLGTAIGDGWFSGADLDEMTLEVYITTLNADSITFTLEGRMKGSAVATTIYTSTAYAAATVTSSINSITPIVITETMDEFRLGFKIVNDTGANSVSALLKGRLARR